jgi:hypothetical protein
MEASGSRKGNEANAAPVKGLKQGPGLQNWACRKVLPYKLPSSWNGIYCSICKATLWPKINVTLQFRWKCWEISRRSIWASREREVHKKFDWKTSTKKAAWQTTVERKHKNKTDLRETGNELKCGVDSSGKGKASVNTALNKFWDWYESVLLLCGISYTDVQ